MSQPTEAVAGSPSGSARNEADDEAIVADCLAGRREGQRQLYDRFSPRIYNLILRMVQQPDDASDLTQETFLRAFATMGTFRGEASLGTWLHRIAVNEALVHLRRSKRHRRLRLRAARSVETATSQDRSDAKLDTSWALAQLEPDGRAVLLLRYQQGLDYAQMAEVLGIPLGTVASRLNRAREAMRRLLADRA